MHDVTKKKRTHSVRHDIGIPHPPPHIWINGQHEGLDEEPARRDFVEVDRSATIIDDGLSRYRIS